jgi:hypothetical protein
MGIKNRLMAILTTGLVSIGGSAIAPTTPAQAALANCPVANIQAFCLYQRTDYSSSGVVEYVYSNVERNTCLPVHQLHNAVWNATGTRWYLFRTTTCNGSHAEIPPGWSGVLPSGYGNGATHAVMRTSSIT